MSVEGYNLTFYNLLYTQIKLIIDQHKKKLSVHN